MFGCLIFSGLIALCSSSSNVFLNNGASEDNVNVSTMTTSVMGENAIENNTPTVKRKRNLLNNNFQLDLEFDKKLSQVDISSENIDVIDKALIDKMLSLDLNIKNEFSNAKLAIEMEDGTIVEKMLFAYRDFTINDVFVSMQSEDDAWYQAKKYGYEELGIYDEDNIYEQYDEFARRDVEQDVTIVENNDSNLISTRNINSSGNTYVEGHLYWYESETVFHPLRNTRVDLYDTEFGQDWFIKLMGTTFTDENGYYRFAFINADSFWDFECGGYDPMIRIYPDSKTFEVAREWLFNDFIFSYYYKCSNVIKNVNTGTTTRLDIKILYSKYDNTSKAFSIGQAMATAQEFAYGYANMPLDKLHLNVIYPQDAFTSFSWSSFSGINTNDWNDWKVIIHEYGHYVEYVMGTYGMNLIDFILKNPSHFIDTDHLHDKSDKKFAMELTWSESWATAFAMILYDTLDLSDIAFTDSIRQRIYDTNIFNPSERKSGEGQEQAVIKYLWDLYDSDNGFNDAMSLGTRNFLNATLRSGIYTLTDFINSFEGEYQNDIIHNGQLLENSQIAPDLLPITYDFNGYEPLTINFIPNGSFYNPNDEFDIEFYSSELNYLTKISNIPINVVGNKSLITYTIDSSIWQDIYNEYLNKYGYVYVSIVGYHKKTPKSGPYHSAFERMNLSSYAHINPKMYGFEESYCSSEENKIVEADEITFNTKRLRTGHIEDEYIVLSPRKEGYGTSYLEYEFNKSIKAIDINLSFWSSDERYFKSDCPMARIEYWDENSNTWIESLDLLNCDLPTDRYKQNKYSIVFDEPIKTFRIYSHFNYMIGYTDRNKGRIAVGDLEVYFV